jgi:hypothetical protein
MNMNPYEPPRAAGFATAVNVNRTPFVLAAIGALLASLYWAGLTLLIGVGVAVGSASPLQVLLPCVLIALYLARGFQIWKGDVNAARRILWLHGFGGIMALVQMSSGGALLVALQSIKIVIHIFGGVTAYLAQRAVK